MNGTMNDAQRASEIKRLVKLGDDASQAADDCYADAGRHLKALKEGRTWQQWVTFVKDNCGIGKTRASELIQIADRKTTVERVRTRRNTSTKKSRQKKTTTHQASPPRGGEASSEPAEDDAQTIWRRGLIFRAKTATGGAAYEDWSGFKADQELIEVVEQAAEAWTKLLTYIRRLRNGEKKVA